MHATEASVAPTDTIVYIDGYNLYHGIRSAGRYDLMWLDLWQFGLALMRDGDRLAKLRYFTSRVSGPPDSVRRQSDWIRANSIRAERLDLDLGRFSRKRVRCFQCGHERFTFEEKHTDVRIACRMLEDAYEGRCTRQIVVSGDSDLVPPIETVRSMPGMGVVVAFPPERAKSKELKGKPGTWFHVEPRTLAACQLPESVSADSGVDLRRPRKWAKKKDAAKKAASGRGEQPRGGL